MPLPGNRPRLLAAIGGSLVKLQVPVCVVREQRTQAGAGKPLPVILPLDLRHLIPGGFQGCGLQRDSPGRALPGHLRLHVELLPSPPEPANFSFARILHHCKPVRMIRLPFLIDRRGVRLGIARHFMGLHTVKVEQKVEQSQLEAHQRFVNASVSD